MRVINLVSSVDAEKDAGHCHHKYHERPISKLRNRAELVEAHIRAARSESVADET